ncbi:MAG TPA: hypothetical protein VHK03_06765 [Aestuariivirgaceae bacterium]|jgi:hypothetical protein|nr:hypothetical protein [Aestuariivirgaceae bacterium]
MIRRAAAVLVLSLTLAAPSLAATTEPGATWPCVQRKVVELSLNSIWQRGDLPDSARQLANDPAVQALAEKLAARRTTMEEADADIKAFAREASVNRDGMMQGLFLALFDRMKGERSEVMAGIERYGRHQIDLAAKVKAEQQEIDRMRNDPKADQAKLASANDQHVWNLRVFEERQKSLSFVCEVPTIIERRLFALARLIQRELGKGQ